MSITSLESSPAGSLGWGRWSPTRLVDPVGVVGVILAIGLWYLVAWIVGKNVPYPHAVLENAVGSLFSSSYLPGIGLPRGGYFPHLAYTFRNVMIGGGIGAIVGILSGLLSFESRVADQITDPIVSLLGTVPIVVAAPFFLLWFGITAISQIALVAFYTGIVLHVFTFRAVSNQPAYYQEYAATLGATPALRFFVVRLPGAVPEIFGGLRIAVGAAWGLAAVTEMLGANFGTGRVIVALRSVYDLTGIVTVVILLGIIAAIVDGLLMLLRSWATRWATTGRAL
jgi:ABC-type nitrate/sulfonate/bicarbonate transport system permease component